MLNKMWFSCFSCCDNNNDIENVDDEIVKNLRPFVFTNIEGKCEIIRVIDGDTYEVFVYISLDKLSEDVVHGRKHDIKKLIYTKHKKAGFYAILTCRLSNIDVAEHDTYHGQYATEKIIERLKKCNNILYCRSPKRINKKGEQLQDEKEKNGRVLLELYFDKSYQHNINDFFYNLKYNNEILALPYDGGKKNDYITNLPKIPKTK